MPDMDRRTLLRLGIAGGGAVALLPWGGRAMAGPAATAAGARQLADGPVPTGGKKLASMGFLFPSLAPFVPDPDPGVATGQLMALATSLLDPNVTAGPGNRDNVNSFGSPRSRTGASSSTTTTSSTSHPSPRNCSAATTRAT